MEKHFNELTPAETERLALLMEECAEVQQMIGKILRHGYESCNPYDQLRTTNRALLERELGDAYLALLLMTEAGDVTPERIAERKDAKRESVEKYLHHQRAV
jgi:hypothetical protein